MPTAKQRQKAPRNRNNPNLECIGLCCESARARLCVHVYSESPLSPHRWNPKIKSTERETDRILILCNGLHCSQTRIEIRQYFNRIDSIFVLAVEHHAATCECCVCLHRRHMCCYILAIGEIRVSSVLFYSFRQYSFNFSVAAAICLFLVGCGRNRSRRSLSAVVGSQQRNNNSAKENFGRN